jgi:ABC-type sugar transport system, periplasmic component
MNMQKTPSLVAMLVAAALSLASCSNGGGKPRIGVSLMDADGAFDADLRSSLESAASGKAWLSVLGARRAQSTLERQVGDMMADKAKAVVADPYDGEAMVRLALQAEAAGVPLVLVGQDPPDGLTTRKGVYFVGSNSAEAAERQAQIVAEYWRSSPGADANENGRLDYVLVRGVRGASSDDASARALAEEFSAEPLPAAPVAVLSCDGTRLGARRVFLALSADVAPEAVICDDDEIALGIAQALKESSSAKGGGRPPVIGRDGTAAGIAAVAEGSLLGTVSRDPSRQGRTAFSLAAILASSGDPEKFGWSLTNGRLALIPCKKVTKENCRLFQD